MVPPSPHTRHPTTYKTFCKNMESYAIIYISKIHIHPRHSLSTSNGHGLKMSKRSFPDEQDPDYAEYDTLPSPAKLTKVQINQGTNFTFNLAFHYHCSGLLSLEIQLFVYMPLPFHMLLTTLGKEYTVNRIKQIITTKFDDEIRRKEEEIFDIDEVSYIFIMEYDTHVSSLLQI